MVDRFVSLFPVQVGLLLACGLLTLTGTPRLEAAAAAPTARFTGYPTRGQAPLEVAFTDRSTPAGAVTKWHWEFSDGGESHEKSPKYTFEEPGSYTVKLTVEGEGGSNTREEKAYVKVAEGVPPKVDFAGRPVTGAAPLKVSFANRTSGATSYEWSFGDQGTSDKQHPLHVYRNPGRYSVSLTATGPGGVASKVMDDYVTVSAAVP